MAIDFSLTYLVATRNKLTYLRATASRLLANMEADEEAIFIDGNSSDGTAGFLSELASARRNCTVISEPDRGESHALNKGLLRARGQLIKPVTDDDVYHWPSIKASKEFMLARGDIDVLGGDTGFTDIESGGDSLVPYGQGLKDYRIWLDSRRPFPFPGLSLMIRRSSLPLIGLFHPGCKLVDYEYTLRASSLGILAWHTGLTAVRVRNAGSNLQGETKAVEDERRRLFAFYGYRQPLRRTLHYMRLHLLALQRRLAGGTAPAGALPEAEFADFTGRMEKRLEDYNAEMSPEFLFPGANC